MQLLFDVFADNAEYVCTRGLESWQGVAAYGLANKVLQTLAGGNPGVLALGEKVLTAARAGDAVEVEKLLDLLEP